MATKVNKKKPSLVCDVSNAWSTFELENMPKISHHLKKNVFDNLG